MNVLRSKCLAGAIVLTTVAPCGLLVQAETRAQLVYREARHYSDLSTQTYQELATQAPDSPYLLALSAEEKAKERQFGNALEDYRKVVAALPALRGVHAAMAEIDTVLGRKADADAEYQLERSLGTPDCAAHKPMCDFLAGHFRSVIDETSSQRAPESLYWRTRAAQELAVLSFAELSKFPNSREYREFRGELLFLTEDYKGVLPELEKLERADPTSAKLNFFVGDGLFETQQIEEAVPYLVTALKLDPALRPADVSLGLAYMRLGEPEKAIPHLKKGLTLDRDGGLYYQLARAYQQTGEQELAQQMMRMFQQRRTHGSSTERAP